MKVTAALSWWNEDEIDLDACVRGMATIADKVVAVDGAYRRYPRAKIRSPLVQQHAIEEAAAAVGIECEVIVPDRLWLGQVEKRSFTLQKAAEGSDWIAVVDADWIISGDREKVRRELQRYGHGIDVLKVPFHTPSAENGSSYATGWHRKGENKTAWIEHIFRALPGFMVERKHWWYSALKHNRRVWVWGGDRSRRKIQAFRLNSPYRIDHLCLSRTEQQIRDARAFLNDRERVVAMTGQEDHIQGLPRPVFDYDTLPY